MNRVPRRLTCGAPKRATPAAPAPCATLLCTLGRGGRTQIQREGGCQSILHSQLPQDSPPSQSRCTPRSPRTERSRQREGRLPGRRRRGRQLRQQLHTASQTMWGAEHEQVLLPTDGEQRSKSGRRRDCRLRLLGARRRLALRSPRMRASPPPAPGRIARRSSAGILAVHRRRSCAAIRAADDLFELRCRTGDRAGRRAGAHVHVVAVRRLELIESQASAGRRTATPPGTLAGRAGRCPLPDPRPAPEARDGRLEEIAERQIHLEHLPGAKRPARQGECRRARRSRVQPSCSSPSTSARSRQRLLPAGGPRRRHPVGRAPPGRQAFDRPYRSA